MFLSLLHYFHRLFSCIFVYGWDFKLDIYTPRGTRPRRILELFEIGRRHVRQSFRQAGAKACIDTSKLRWRADNTHLHEKSEQKIPSICDETLQRGSKKTNDTKKRMFEKPWIVCLCRASGEAHFIDLKEGICTLRKNRANEEGNTKTSTNQENAERRRQQKLQHDLVRWTGE